MMPELPTSSRNTRRRSRPRTDVGYQALEIEFLRAPTHDSSAARSSPSGVVVDAAAAKPIVDEVAVTPFLQIVYWI
jgi:hypothetical protein